MPPRRLPALRTLELQRELDSIRRSVTQIEAWLSEADAESEASPLGDDAVVDQHTVPAPRDLYLRLARRGAFRSRKLGRRVLAQWGEVRRALLEGPDLRKASAADERAVDGPGDALDGLRRHLGLVTKGR